MTSLLTVLDDGVATLELVAVIGARLCLGIALSGLLVLAVPNDFAQSNSSGNEPVRVSVTVNADGSRTAYQFDQPNHKATATTTTPEGKVLGRIDYQTDDAGRFISGIVFGANEKFLFKSNYKYGNAGRLEEETHLGKDDALINRIIYTYESDGRPTGYTVYDASGKVIERSSPIAPPPTASAKPRKSRR